MEKEIKKIVDRVLSEEINKASLRIKNRIFENKEMCSECGGYKGSEMFEGKMCECGPTYEGDIKELGGMDDGHPSMGNIRLSHGPLQTKTRTKKYFLQRARSSINKDSDRDSLWKKYQEYPLL